VNTTALSFVINNGFGKNFNDFVNEFRVAEVKNKLKLGVIVGEPTGGTKRGLNGGQMFFLTLPNSKFEIDLPIVHYYHKGFPDEGVMPDYVVETTREAIQNDQDRQLSFTLKMLVK